MAENEQLVTSEQLEENANEIAMKFWAQTGETSYTQMAERVVNYIYEGLPDADMEKVASRFILVNKDFIPNSPCWTNAGTDMKSLSACFVIDLQDNMVDIMETAKKMALIMKEGGGVGVSLSNIRPKGARVGKEGSKRTASGPIPFLHIFDSVVGAVKSAGVRRGAAMANLRIDHPDIIEFIRCKEDQNKINNFNISVAITDEFMKKVLDPNDKEIWALETKEEWNEETKKVEKTSIPYTAKEVYDLIIDHMWRNGEPGAQFIDNVNNSVYEEKVARDLRNLNKDEDLSYDPKEHVKYTGRPEFIEYNTNLKVSNPCVTGDTQILTDKGYLPIKDLVGKKVNVWNGEEWSEVEPRKMAENQELLLIKYDDGSELKCTHYHNIPLVKGITAASEVKPGDKLMKFKYPSIEGEKELRNAYTQGVYSGDGTLYYPGGKKSGKEPLPFIEFYHEKKSIMKYCALLRKNSEATLLKKSVGNIPDIDFKDKSFVPDSSYTIQSRLNWLAGLIDTDGSKNSVEGSIGITSINKPFLMDIKKMLSTLGVKSRVTVIKKATIKPMPDGKGGLKGYPCKECYRLLISASNVYILLEMGLQLHRVKVSPEPDRDASRFITISSVEPLETKEDVYCFNEPKRHMFVANTQLTCNCGETWLHPNEACNLGHINLYNFITPFWSTEPGAGVKRGKGWINVLRLKAVVESSVDFMNRMIDKSEFPLPEITEQVRASRKIGIGVMGLADTLSALAIPYNSEEGREVTEFLLNFITGIAEKCSLAKGWKNATLTLIAPTGTTGIVGNVSGGIEPHFLRVWEKNLTDNRGRLIMAPRSLVEFKESDYYKSNPDKWDKEIPTIWPTAHEVSPEDHIRMLISVQRCVHNSVSKTINLPNKSKAEDINGLIQMAWENGVKGFTCYRDGSRDSQPMKSLKADKEDKEDNKDNKEVTDEEVSQIFKAVEEGKAVKLDGAIVISEEAYGTLLKFAELGYQQYVDLASDSVVADYLKEHGSDNPCSTCPNKQAEATNRDNSNKQQSTETPKRPRPLETFGVTRKLRTGCGNLYVTVNSDDQGVCEVFTNLGRTGGCPSQSEAVCRLISLALRANVSPEAVVEQLKGIRCMSVLRKNQDGILNKDIHITSCPDAIGKIIEKELQKLNKPIEKQEPVSNLDPQLSSWASNIGHAQENKAVSPAPINSTTLMGEDSQVGVCPECGNELQRSEGCVICRNCGYSKCG